MYGEGRYGTGAAEVCEALVMIRRAGVASRAFDPGGRTRNSNGWFGGRKVGGGSPATSGNVLAGEHGGTHGARESLSRLPPTTKIQID